MKKLLIVGAIALMAASSAWANEECRPGEEPGHPDPHCPQGKTCPVKCTKEACFTVVCHYQAKDRDDHYQKCRAASTFVTRVTSDGGEVQGDSDLTNSPKFEVECDGHMIYNNGARRFTDLLGTRIQAETGPFPAIVLPRGELHDGHHFSPSWLELGEQNLRGSCYLYTEDRPEPRPEPHPHPTPDLR